MQEITKNRGLKVGGEASYLDNVLYINYYI